MLVLSQISPWNQHALASLQMRADDELFKGSLYILGQELMKRESARRTSDNTPLDDDLESLYSEPFADKTEEATQTALDFSLKSAISIVKSPEVSAGINKVYNTLTSTTNETSSIIFGALQDARQVTKKTQEPIPSNIGFWGRTARSSLLGIEEGGVFVAGIAKRLREKYDL